MSDESDVEKTNVFPCQFSMPSEPFYQVPSGGQNSYCFEPGSSPNQIYMTAHILCGGGKPGSRDCGPYSIWLGASTSPPGQNTWSQVSWNNIYSASVACNGQDSPVLCINPAAYFSFPGNVDWELQVSILLGNPPDYNMSYWYYSSPKWWFMRLGGWQLNEP